MPEIILYPVVLGTAGEVISGIYLFISLGLFFYIAWYLGRRLLIGGLQDGELDV